MIGRSTIVKVVVFAVLTIAGIGYTAVHYLNVGNGIFGNGYTAYVDLADSGGIFTNASVTYRGIEVGRVGSIRLRPDGIRVALHITSGKRIPANAHAVVGNGSAIGEQYVDLQPTNSSAPFLHNGSIIPQSHTSLPVTTQDLVVDVDRLVRSVPRSDLVTVIDEVGKGFRNAGPALQQLLDATHQLVTDAQHNFDPTVALINQSGPVLGTQISAGDDIKSFARDLAAFTDQLRRSDGDLRAVVHNGTDFAGQLSGFDHDVDATLPLLLHNLTSLSEAVDVRLPALQQVLIGYPYVIATTYGIFPGCPGNGLSRNCASTVRFGIPTPADPLPSPCTQGYLPPAQHRLPSDEKYASFRYGPRCTAPTSANQEARGPREAPEPGGTRLGDDPTYRKNDGLPENGGGWNGQPGPFSSQSSSATASPQGMRMAPFGSAQDASSNDSVLTSSGGQQPLLGDDQSWKVLIFRPLMN